MEAFARKHQTRSRKPGDRHGDPLCSRERGGGPAGCPAGHPGGFPQAQVLFAGQYQDVIGEQAYADRLMPRHPRIREQGSWTFLGNLNQQELAAFYPNLDVLVVPSLNSTEAFGLVQVEAMMNNVPCVASALPGVRRPCRCTTWARWSRSGIPPALAEALMEILD